MTLKSSGSKINTESVVIFEPIETSAASLTSSASATSLASTTSTALFPQNFPHPDDLIIPDSKMTNMSPFLCKE